MAEGDLYRLLAWLSLAYPTGAFAYSHGIEFAVEAGLVKDHASLVDWVAHILGRGMGWIDAVLFARAYDAAAAGDEDALDAISELAAALRGTSETALESSQQGAAFLATTRAAWPDPRLEAFAARRGTGPVALAVALAVAAAGRIERSAALAAFVQTFGANLVSAGVRLIPLGQTDGQRAIANLAPAVHASARAALERRLEDLGGAAPMVEWTSLRHETQHTRLFRS
ncbi:MAG: urease accessory protein UreF [Pseudomonadota bacterium]